MFSVGEAVLYMKFSPDHPDVVTWRLAALSGEGVRSLHRSGAWAPPHRNFHLRVTVFTWSNAIHLGTILSDSSEGWTGRRLATRFFYFFEKVEQTEGEESIILWPAFLIAIRRFVRYHVKYRLTARRNCLIFVIQCCVFHFREPFSCITLQEISV